MEVKRAQWQRSVEVFLSPVSGVEEWKGLQRVIHVKRQTTRNGCTSSKDSYYITSLNIDDAEQFATGIRGHWSIENRLPGSRTLFNTRMMQASKKAMESKHYLY